MQNFKRISIKSTVVIFKPQSENNLLFALEGYERDNIVLQMIEFLPDTYLIEYIPRGDDNTLEGDQENDNATLDTYLNTMINIDPFGGKYSKKLIKEVFEAGDKEWLDNALKNLKNSYIREKLEYIVNRGGYGKIKYTQQ